MAGCLNWIQTKVALISSHGQDDFCSTLRKMTITIMGLILTPLFCAFAAGLGRRFFGDEDRQVVSEGVALFAVVSWCVYMPANYLYLRYRKGKITDLQVEVTAWVLSIGWALIMVSVPDYDPRHSAGLVTLLLALLQVKTFWVQFVLLAILTLLSMVNEVIWVASCPLTPEDPAAFYFVLPGVQRYTNLASLLQGKGSVILTQWALTLCVKAQCAIHTKHLESNQKVNEMAAKVVESLSRYNTEEAREIIEEYGEVFGQGGGVNADEGTRTEANVNKNAQRLVTAFSRMNDNLDRYKPFLPNYLFLDTTDESEEKEEESGAEDSEGKSRIISEVASGSRGKGRAAIQSVRSADSSTGPTRSTFMDDVESNASSRNGQRLSKSRTGANAAKRNRRQSHRTDKYLGHRNHGPAGITTAESATMAVFRGKISTAIVDIAGSTIQATLAGTQPTDLPVFPRLSELLDTVYITATATKGSVHSMLGDRIQVTWNATHRVAMPETKACSFALKLRAAIDKMLDLYNQPAAYSSLHASDTNHGDDGADSSPSTPGEQPSPFSACVVSGMASVHHIATNKTRQQALVVDADWLPVVDECFQLSLSCNLGINPQGRTHRHRASSSCSKSNKRIRGATSCSSIITEEVTQRVACYHMDMRPINRLSFVPRSKVLETLYLPDHGLGEQEGEDELSNQNQSYFDCSLRDTTSTDKSRDQFLPAHQNKRVIYELIQEAEATSSGGKGSAGGDSEWMYELQNRGGASNNATTGAVGGEESPLGVYNRCFDLFTRNQLVEAATLARENNLFSALSPRAEGPQSTSNGTDSDRSHHPCIDGPNSLASGWLSWLHQQEERRNGAPSGQ